MASQGISNRNPNVTEPAKNDRCTLLRVRAVWKSVHTGMSLLGMHTKGCPYAPQCSFYSGFEDWSDFESGCISLQRGAEVRWVCTFPQSHQILHFSHTKYGSRWGPRTKYCWLAPIAWGACLTLCIRETPKWVLWQTVKTQWKSSVFITELCLTSISCLLPAFSSLIFPYLLSMYNMRLILPYHQEWFMMPEWKWYKKQKSVTPIMNFATRKRWQSLEPTGLQELMFCLEACNTSC